MSWTKPGKFSLPAAGESADQDQNRAVWVAAGVPALPGVDDALLQREVVRVFASGRDAMDRTLDGKRVRTVATVVYRGELEGRLGGPGGGSVLGTADRPVGP